MLSSLDHAVIIVEDLDVAEADYSALLGLKPSWRGTHPHMGTSNVLYRLSNAYLELLSFGENGEPSATAPSNSEGLRALAFGVDDIDSEVVRIKEAGLNVSDTTEGSGIEASSGAERRWRAASIDPTDTAGLNLFLIQHVSPRDALPLASREGEASVDGLDHAVIFVSDADVALGTYRDKLGFDLRLDKTFEQWGMRLMFFRVGDLILELAHSIDVGNRRDGFWGLSYRVADVDSARERLVARGFDVSEVRDGRRPRTRVITVRSRTHGVATLMISA